MLCKNCKSKSVDSRIDRTRCPTCWAEDQKKWHGVSLRAGHFPRGQRKGGKIIRGA